MKSIEIYMEGGGEGSGNKALLRNGLNGFLGALKQAAQKKGIGWKLTVCGPRTKAFREFNIAVTSADGVMAFLLVDSEGPVATKSALAHLLATAGFQTSSNTTEGMVHLMIQTMEAWIVADVETVEKFYQKGFAASALPKADDLEKVAKTQISTGLDKATGGTTKGTYQKIAHASQLLTRINPAIVHQRCPSSRRFFDKVSKAVAAD